MSLNVVISYSGAADGLGIPWPASSMMNAALSPARSSNVATAAPASVIVIGTAVRRRTAVPSDPFEVKIHSISRSSTE